jgi:hypothetical protein
MEAMNQPMASEAATDPALPSRLIADVRHVCPSLGSLLRHGLLSRHVRLKRENEFTSWPFKVPVMVR